MVLPVIQHSLIKVSLLNRRRFIKCAFVFSTFACASNIICVLSNEWLYTSELLKYYVLPNGTVFQANDINDKIYYKNATLGPWLFCWLDPVTSFHCGKVNFFVADDPSDVTTSVELAIRYSYSFVFAGCILNICGFLFILICCLRPNPYRILFFSTVFHIISGLTNFMSVVVFMSAVSKEVGNKIYKSSLIDEPLFSYNYGYSIISFLFTEATSIFSVIVFMSKRDEQMFNRYQIRTLLKNINNRKDNMNDSAILHERYYQHARFTLLQKSSRNYSLDDEPLSNVETMKTIGPKIGFKK